MTRKRHHGRVTARNDTWRLQVYPEDQRALRRVSLDVTEVDDDLRRLAGELRDTMDAEGGWGISAPQLGVHRRIILTRQPGWHDPLVIINPTALPAGRDELGWEGCLSFPGIFAEIWRPPHCLVQGTDLDGQPVEFGATGINARCVLHEIDHLDGVVLVDHFNDYQRQHLNSIHARFGSRSALTFRLAQIGPPVTNLD